MDQRQTRLSCSPPKTYHCHWWDLPQVLFLSLCYESFVTTNKNVCLSWQNMCLLCTSKVLSQQIFCHDKMVFLATNICYDKTSVMISILLLREKMWFVTTNTCLLWRTRVCCDETFAATKMILVAAPASDYKMVKNSFGITPATFSSSQSSTSSTVTLIQDGHQRKLNLPTIWRSKFPLPN